MGLRKPDRRAPPDRVKEPVDASGGGAFGLLACLPGSRPNQFVLDGLGELLDHLVVVAVSLAAHREQNTVLSELGLVVDRAILLSAVEMTEQPRRRNAGRN